MKIRVTAPLFVFFAACGGTVRPPPIRFAAADRPVNVAVPLAIGARVPISGVVGADYDGAARVAQKTYTVVNLKQVINERLQGAARAHGWNVAPAGGAPLQLTATFRTIEVETHGLFASGDPKIRVQAELELVLRDGTAVYAAPLAIERTNTSNEPEELFTALDGAIAGWFDALGDQILRDAALAARLEAAPEMTAASGAIAQTNSASPQATEQPDFRDARASQRYRAGRIFLSPLMGYLFGGAAQLGLIVAANAVCNGEPGLELEYEKEGCGVAFAFGGLGAALFMVPAGVALSSDWLDGMPGYGTALLGAALGLLAPFAAVGADIELIPGLVIGSMLMPISSMITYELVAWQLESRAMSVSEVAIVPIFDRDLRGASVVFAF
jgi:hypothetical protein